MTEKEYKAINGIRRSALWLISDSPQKFRWAEINPEPPTPAMVFGTMVHKLLLEPETFDNEFAVVPACDRRTKEGKAIYEAFMANLDGKDVELVSSEDYETAVQMVQAAKESPYVERLLIGEHEKAIIWTDDLTGEVCKSRLDSLGEVNGKPLIVDYKTTTDASTDAFMRTAINLGYDFQAAFEIEAVKNGTDLCKDEDPTFVFIVQEKKAPFAVNILAADPMFIERGQNLFRELIGIYHDCKQSNEWYGYLGKYSNINNVTLPAWLAKELEG